MSHGIPTTIAKVNTPIKIIGLLNIDMTETKSVLESLKSHYKPLTSWPLHVIFLSTHALDLYFSSSTFGITNYSRLSLVVPFIPSPCCPSIYALSPSCLVARYINSEVLKEVIARHDRQKMRSNRYRGKEEGVLASEMS
jgi:hypothetical protein